MNQQLIRKVSQNNRGNVSRTTGPYRRARRCPEAFQEQAVTGNYVALCNTGTPAMQSKLAITRPDDKYEREADCVAQQVMRTPNTPAVQSKYTCGSKGVAGECAECRKKRLSRQAHRDTELNTVPPVVHEVLRSPGRPLDTTIRSFMESHFGHDFSKVRIHTDRRANDSAQEVNAQAYTMGQHIVFGTEQYAPRTLIGQRLLAHELTHVVQQRQRRQLVFGKQSASGVPSIFRIILKNVSIVPKWRIVENTIKQAIEPLAKRAGRELRFGRREPGDLKLTFSPGGRESRPCSILFLGNEGGGDIWIGAHEDFRVCSGPRRDPQNPQFIDYVSQLEHVFDPEEPAFGRFVGNTSVHELGHIMAQLSHTSDQDNFMYAVSGIGANLPREMRTKETMRLHWAGQKSFKPGQVRLLVQAIRTGHFTGGMQVTTQNP